jgi:hypothetical protein
MDFLMQAGGEPAGDLSVNGKGWHARLEGMEPAQIGPAISVRRDLLVIEGDDPAIVTPVYDFIRKNMIRGGG